MNIKEPYKKGQILPFFIWGNSSEEEDYKLGIYFVGQTETIRLGKGKNAWGSLVNSFTSDANLLVNAFTITNYSNQPFTAKIWFNPIPHGKAMISNKVTPANTALSPLPKPEGKIAFAELVEGFPKGGVNVFIFLKTVNRL